MFKIRVEPTLCANVFLVYFRINGLGICVAMFISDVCGFGLEDTNLFVSETR